MPTLGVLSVYIRNSEPSVTPVRVALGVQIKTTVCNTARLCASGQTKTRKENDFINPAAENTFPEQCNDAYNGDRHAAASSSSMSLIVYAWLVSRHFMVVVVRLYVRERCQVHREDQVVVVGAAAFVVMVVVGSMALESRYRDCCR